MLDWKGLDEQARFRHTANFFASEEVETVSDLKKWLASGNNRDRLITTSTLPDKAGIAKIADKTADYYCVMVCLEDAVAIDSLIRAFLKGAGAIL